VANNVAASIVVTPKTPSTIRPPKEGRLFRRRRASALRAWRLAAYLASVLALLCMRPSTLGAQTPAPDSGPTAAQLLTPHQRVAVVGDRLILAGDVLPSARQALNQLMAPYAKTMPPAEFRRQWEMGLPAVYQKLLRQKIDIQLVYLDFEKTIPPDKIKSVLENITKQVNQQFYDHELESLQKQLHVDSITALEQALNRQGSSIAHQKEEFRQQMIAQTMVSKNATKNPEISPDQLLEYYREHESEYEITAKAQWEKLPVRFDRFPSRAEAERAIVDDGKSGTTRRPALGSREEAVTGCACSQWWTA